MMFNNFFTDTRVGTALNAFGSWLTNSLLRTRLSDYRTINCIPLRTPIRNAALATPWIIENAPRDLWDKVMSMDWNHITGVADLELNQQHNNAANYAIVALYGALAISACRHVVLEFQDSRRFYAALEFGRRHKNLVDQICQIADNNRGNNDAIMDGIVQVLLVDDCDIISLTNTLQTRHNFPVEIRDMLSSNAFRNGMRILKEIRDTTDINENPERNIFLHAQNEPTLRRMTHNPGDITDPIYQDSILYGDNLQNAVAEFTQKAELMIDRHALVIARGGVLPTFARDNIGSFLSQSRLPSREEPRRSEIEPQVVGRGYADHITDQREQPGEGGGLNIV